jgi:hypothetical protein
MKIGSMAAYDRGIEFVLNWNQQVVVNWNQQRGYTEQ